MSTTGVVPPVEVMRFAVPDTEATPLLLVAHVGQLRFPFESRIIGIDAEIAIFAPNILKLHPACAHLAIGIASPGCKEPPFGKLLIV